MVSPPRRASGAIRFSGIGPFFEDLLGLRGDIGGKPVIQQNPSVVYTVEVGESARRDLDDPEALRNAGGVLGQHSQKP